MKSNHSASPQGTISRTQQLGSNERAILDHIGNHYLRRLVTAIVQVKMRLQFTGWLQYMPSGLFSLLFFLLSAGAYLINLSLVAYLFLALGGMLLVIFTFDLVTVKFHLHPAEPLPERLDDLKIFDLMRTRRSCRSFQRRQLTAAHFDELMACVRLHSAKPTIGEAPIRFEYVAAPLTVWPVVNATEFLVAIVPRQYERLAIIDVGRSLQKIAMACTRMGLGTCWIGPGADQTSIIKHLGDRFNPERDHIICVCAVGYKSRYIPLLVRLMNRQLYGRLPLSELFFMNGFNQPLPVEKYPFNQFGRNYEICQWAPSSYNGQTTRCVAVTEPDHSGHERSLTRFDFYAVTASRYYAPVALGIWCANWEMGCQALGLDGHFTRLSASERDVDKAERLPLPRYDVSWVLT